jgi:hypothetical protein
MKQIIIFLIIPLLLISCNTSNAPINTITKHNYHVSTDSIEQTLELFSMGDSSTQFTLRVENKNLDSLDSYMSHAFTIDGKHFKHSRKNCTIAFEILDIKKDTIKLTNCDCPELTIPPIYNNMATDTTDIIVFR